VENKKITSAILIATFLLAIPFVPARASGAANLSLSPSSPSADIGGSFVVNVMVSGTTNVIGFDITVMNNPNVLTVTGVSLGGLLTGQNVLVAKSDMFPSIGMIRWAAVILGGGTVTPSPSGSLLAISYTVNDPSATPSETASDFPSALTISAASVVDLDGGVISEVPVTMTGASYGGPAVSDLALVNVQCRAQTGGLNTGAKGFSDGLFCKITNTGAIGIMARGDFSWHSLGGVIGGTSGSPVALAPGQNGEVDATLTVPNANDVFIVSGTATRVIVFADSSMLAISGPTGTFKVNVNTP
jgi:cohesin domain-containing protein